MYAELQKAFNIFRIRFGFVWCDHCKKSYEWNALKVGSMILRGWTIRWLCYSCIRKMPYGTSWPSG